LSGGVDTCAILAAARKLGVMFAAGVTVSTGPDSPDLPFAIAAAEEAGLMHHVVHVTSADLVGTHLPACVKLLNTFDGMTLRNSLVVAAAMHKVSKALRYCCKVSVYTYIYTNIHTHTCIYMCIYLYIHIYT